MQSEKEMCRLHNKIRVTQALSFFLQAQAQFALLMISVSEGEQIPSVTVAFLLHKQVPGKQI